MSIFRKDRSLPIEWVFLYIENGAFYMLSKHLSENRTIQQVLTIWGKPAFLEFLIDCYQK